MDKNQKPNNNPGDNIVQNDIVEEMRTSYLDYAMSVIVSRALPDVRDGLKPVHRRVLYVMHESGLTHSAKFRKSATVVGDALGRYHPHNPDAVYDSMVRMAQTFSLRYPLVDGQGNFGSMDGDPPAAYRYTEARMTAMAEQILKDIEKDTVDFVPNYDNTRLEPRVLPATFPQLIVNGTLGIAVGMATNIPPHNLGEVIDATTHIIDNPNATSADLMEFIKGPDFPTGGIVFNKKDISHAYSTGRGGVVVRGEADIVEMNGSFHIIIKSIPYQVNKSELIIRIADLVREKRIDGIKDIRDESDKEGLRISIDLKSGANPQNILNNLYKRTDIERVFHFNMIALVDGIQPKLLPLSEILTHFIHHRKEVIERRTKFDLARAEARAHILEGLVRALDHIDAIIKTIKVAKDRDAAHAALVRKFKFSKLQANAILELRLQTLAGLEQQKIEDELKEKRALVKDLKSILSSKRKLMGVVKQELVEVKEKFGDERKTKVVARAAESLSYEDLIPNEDAVMIITKGGYIKRISPEAYHTQHRGGKGVMDMNTKEEDFITILANGTTHDDTLFFTDKGKVYQEKFYTIPEGKRTTRGKSIVNFLPVATDESVTSVLIVPRKASSSATKNGKKAASSLILVTKNGIIKKTDASAFDSVRKSGIIAMSLEKGDELLFARSIASGDRIIIATSKGQSIYFDERDVRKMGRAAGGVRAIKLNEGDSVVGANVIAKGEEGEHYLLTMTARGYGKRTLMKQYRIQKRSGSGIKTAQVTSKTGDVMASQMLGPNHSEVIVMSEKGQVIRIEVKQIPSLGRATQGVRIIKLKAGDALAALTRL